MLQNGWDVVPLKDRNETTWQLMAAIAQAAFEIAGPVIDDEPYSSLEEAFKALGVASEQGRNPSAVHQDYRPNDRLNLTEVQSARDENGGLTILFAKGRQVMLNIKTSQRTAGLLSINSELLRVAYGNEAEAKRNQILERAQVLLNGMERIHRH
jgi:hypothetical protein